MNPENLAPAPTKHIALFIEEASVQWVSVIQTAQEETAGVNDVLSQKLMALYTAENKALSSIMNHLNTLDKKSKTYAERVQIYGNEMQVTQKKWDSVIQTVQSSTQELSSQMQAQGNDAQQATTSAAQMANLLQIITSLLQSSL